ncbi:MULTISPECIES: hypothetical protein [unclassified Methanoculleus]|jgi:hypothetical protein|uniref:hypothetical protein n=1 Tax=unclassified Methanoculleus TaxID=2619537 RepID=UPI0025F3805F|nr:hypothetical protein [Methanoculleus sp. UBA377]
MADFVQKTVNKTAIRDLAVPIADVTSFNNLIETVIDDNPFGCVGYTGPGGQPVAAVVRNREHYTAKVDFINEETAKRVGSVSLQSPSIAAFNANAAEALANATLAAAMGGVAERNNARETYYAQLKCHDPSGDSKPSASHALVQTSPRESKPFGLLLLLPLAALSSVATPTSPSPGRPSGTRLPPPACPTGRERPLRRPPWSAGGREGHRRPPALLGSQGGDPKGRPGLCQLLARPHPAHRLPEYFCAGLRLRSAAGR